VLLLAVALAILALNLISRVPYTYRAGARQVAPRLVGLADRSFPDMIASVAAANDGLPRGDAQVHGQRMLAGSASLVQEWAVQRVEMRNTRPLFADGDTHCLLDVEVRVTYADGTSADLLWSTASYGYHLGPLYVATGSGPPWDIRVVAGL